MVARFAKRTEIMDQLLGTTPKHSQREFDDHVTGWSDCSACSLCRVRNQVVLYRGFLPADYLFIGEAPGGDEDREGLPFVGKAGEVLQAAIDLLSKEIEALELPEFRYGITNIIACFPGRNAANGFNKPTTHQANACRSRLEEMVEIASPKLVILLGKISEQYAERINGLKTFDMYHPSYILRQGGVNSQAFRSWFNELSRRVMKDYAKVQE